MAVIYGKSWQKCIILVYKGQVKSRKDMDEIVN